MVARYRHLLIYDVEPAPRAEELARIERACGAALPPDFVDFLAVANGGVLAEYSIDAALPGGKQALGFDDVLCSRATATTPSILGGMAERDARGLPRTLCPFARDGGGSTVYLDVTGGGRVLAWVLGLPSWTGLSPETCLVPLADCFRDYVDRLYIEPDYARELLDAALASGDSSRLAAVREWLDIGMPDWRLRLGVGA